MKNTDRFYHPWHSLPIGKKAPEVVSCIIEIQRGSKAKYELDKETGFLRLDRILSSHLSYPFHYGYLPLTYCDDNDPLDILIICSEVLTPLSIVEARVIGAIEMVDQGEQDDKIIAVVDRDPSMQHIKDLSDLKKEVESIKQFFEEYKKPEGKEVIVEKLLDRNTAYTLINQSLDLYKKTFSK